MWLGMPVLHHVGPVTGAIDFFDDVTGVARRRRRMNQGRDDNAATSPRVAPQGSAFR